MAIVRICCYGGFMFVVGIILSPATSGDWSAMWMATKYFGWVAVVLVVALAVTYMRGGRND